MKKVIIPQKMSGTGSIHDLASQHFDRDIVFKEGELFAVVLASYYGGGNRYSTHRSEKTACVKSREVDKFSHGIIGADGHVYERGYYEDLVQVSDEPVWEVVEA